MLNEHSQVSLTQQAHDLSFMQGGGEMGALTRGKDWGKTSLGEPGNWPQSLRTTLSILLHSGFPMVLFWGPDLLCFYNDAFRPSLGKDGRHPAILGQKGEQAWADIWNIAKPWIDQVLGEGKAIWNEDMLVPIFRNGTIEDVYWTFSYSPVTDESGKRVGVFVAVVETTEKVKTLTQLGESEKRFRAMADNIPNLAWMADADGWIYWYNKKWYDFTGTTPAQMEGWGWQSVHDPKVLPRVIVKWKNSIVHGEPFDMIFPLKGKDGTYRQFLTRVLPLRDEEGNIKQWFGTNTDVTQQIETEQALKESEERFRTMAEASDILIATADETSNATYFNRAWVKLTGRPMEDLLKFGWVDLVHPEDKEQYLHIYLSAFEKRISFTGEFRVLNQKGEYRWLFAQGPPLFRPDGSFAGYISSSIDITEQKEAYRKIEELVAARTSELTKANDSLQHMNHELQSFAYISSHDLQEPLRKIQTFASQILEKEFQNLSPNGKDKFKRMQNAAERMQQLIDDLLSYSRTSTAARNFVQTDLGKIIDDVKEDLKEEIQQKDATLQVNGAGNVNVIPFQFRQLLFNLLSNSLKFSDESRRPLIIIESEIVEQQPRNFKNESGAEKFCHISISDNGIGFEQEFSEKIFEVFQRLHGKHSYTGTGIGLAIVKKIVENHYGTITATGKIGKGATFDIYIPV